MGRDGRHLGLCRSVRNCGLSSAGPTSIGLVAEGVLQALSMGVVLWVIFGRVSRGLELFYLSFIPVIWVAVRQGLRRVVTILVGLNFGIALAMRFSNPSHALVLKLG